MNSRDMVSADDNLLNHRPSTSSSCCEDPLDYSTCAQDDAPRRRRRQHQARRYGTLSVTLKLLERWFELGVRPTEAVVHHLTVALLGCPDINYKEDDEDNSSNNCNMGEDDTYDNPIVVVAENGQNSCTDTDTTLQHLAHSIALQWDHPVDDIQALQNLVHTTRTCFLWKAALPPSPDPHLVVQPSEIPNAGSGLFAARDLPAHAIVCYYSGDLHSYKTSQSTLQDASYLLRIGPVAPRPWWYKALVLGSEGVSCPPKDTWSDGAKEDDDNKNNGSAAATTAPDNPSTRAYAALAEQWDQLVPSCSTSVLEELYVNPSNPHIKARYINDCLAALQEDNDNHKSNQSYNVEFVLDPTMERAAVVTLRPILKGEELYVSYGEAYWESLQATLGVIPHRSLPTKQQQQPQDETNS